MQRRNLWSSRARLTGFCAWTLGLLTAIPFSIAQTAQPWMDTSLPPEARAEMVLKQKTLDGKLALLHGDGMAHASQWQILLTHLANGGAGYIEGVERLGIPPLFISDAGYGVRDSGPTDAIQQPCLPLLGRRRARILKQSGNTVHSLGERCARKA